MLSSYSINANMNNTSDLLTSGIKGGVERSYKFLCDTFRPGDRIYSPGSRFLKFSANILLRVLTGFSRGAYQVRVLAGMIEKVEMPPIILYLKVLM
jgi:uncharacterized protein (DUF2235 family)